MGSKCPIPTIAIAAAAIAASVIAAVIVAVIVFLLLSSFASKKLYDAIKSAKESEMTSATESGLYQEKEKFETHLFCFFSHLFFFSVVERTLPSNNLCVFWKLWE
jgi:hypothetical protein